MMQKVQDLIFAFLRFWGSFISLSTFPCGTLSFALGVPFLSPVLGGKNVLLLYIKFFSLG